MRSAWDRADMRSLATELVSIPSAARPAIAARIMAEQIMLPTQWWVRFGLWILKRRGLSVYSAWAHILTRAPQLADELIGQTADWIVSGKEAGGQGVGGLNQSEVDKLSLIIRLARSG